MFGLLLILILMIWAILSTVNQRNWRFANKITNKLDQLREIAQESPVRINICELKAIDNFASRRENSHGVQPFGDFIRQAARI